MVLWGPFNFDHEKNLPKHRFDENRAKLLLGRNSRIFWATLERFSMNVARVTNALWAAVWRESQFFAQFVVLEGLANTIQRSYNHIKKACRTNFSADFFDIFIIFVKCIFGPKIGIFCIAEHFENIGKNRLWKLARL